MLMYSGYIFHETNNNNLFKQFTQLLFDFVIKFNLNFIQLYFDLDTWN